LVARESPGFIRGEDVNLLMLEKILPEG
jgi:hypothetical protein